MPMIVSEVNMPKLSGCFGFSQHRSERKSTHFSRIFKGTLEISAISWGNQHNLREFIDELIDIAFNFFSVHI